MVIDKDEQIAVLGIDSAMRNTGWSLQSVKTGEFLQWLEDSQHFGTTPPSDGTSTHKWMERLDGGTITQTDTSRWEWERIWDAADELFDKIAHEWPGLIVIEHAFVRGRKSGSPTGTAMFCEIMRRLIKDPSQNDPAHPDWVVAVEPGRLNSLAYRKKKTTGRETVNFYKERTGLNHRCTEHEADAYHLAYHGVRFLMTAISSKEDIGRTPWPRSILDKNEQRIFLDDPKTAMIGRYSQDWWTTTPRPILT